MRWAEGLVLALVTVVVTAEPSRCESNAAQAEVYVRKACESVLGNAAQYQVERCTLRAMASMGDVDRLRDNELKRLLVDSERGLDTCREELDRVKEDTATGETPTARPKPESSSES